MLRIYPWKQRRLVHEKEPMDFRTRADSSERVRWGASIRNMLCIERTPLGAIDRGSAGTHKSCGSKSPNPSVLFDVMR